MCRTRFEVGKPEAAVSSMAKVTELEKKVEAG